MFAKTKTSTAASGSGHFLPCTERASLLKLQPRVADGKVFQELFSVRKFFRASPFFEIVNKNGEKSWVKVKSISRGARDGDPNRDDNFDLMVMQTENQNTNLPRRFLRENAVAITFNTHLKPKGREPRQPNE